MFHLPAALADESVRLVASALFWSCATVFAYWTSKQMHRRRPHWWNAPLVLAPVVLGSAVLLLHSDYRHYLSGTHWLVFFVGPATVAFAVPIYEQRELLRREWPALSIGILVGSLASMACAWMLASLLSIDGALRLSLLPRSVSTPFAMVISEEIGGVPNLTAAFTLVTGIVGTVCGERLLQVLPVASASASGALFGMGAHGAGVAQAHQIGRAEGSAAGVVMVIVGLVNVLVTPVLAHLLA